MRTSFKSIAKNFSSSLMANLVNAGATVVAILIVSKFFSVADFSYWQLYIFYVNYAGLFHLGWTDGVYLRYGGKNYEDLDTGRLGTQFWLLLATQLVISIIAALLTTLFVDDSDLALILILTGINCLLLNSRALLQFILLATNRVTPYAVNIIGERIIYLSLIGVVILFGLLGYEYLLMADIVAKIVTLIAICYVCRDLIFSKLVGLRESLGEAFLNISVGLRLMLASTASMLIIGIARFAIERIWGVEEFGKVSLALMVANVAMIFIGALSIVIFPLLKRADSSRLSSIYSLLRSLLMLVVLGFLPFYYPLHALLSAWLPSYSDSLVYLALLFPVCVYEAKVTMLTVTYMKAIRREKDILFVNIVAVAMSLIGVSISALWLHDLTLTVLSVVVVLALRAIISEYALSKHINIQYKKDAIIELMMTGIFIVTAWYLDSLSAFAIYMIVYLAYVYFKRVELKKIVKLVIAR